MAAPAWDALEANHATLRNFSEHWHNCETIPTVFVESTVSAVVSKCFVKKQQMQGTKRGAHLLLLVRILVLDEDLDALFPERYPGFRPAPESERPAQPPPGFYALQLAIMSAAQIHAGVRTSMSSRAATNQCR